MKSIRGKHQHRSLQKVDLVISQIQPTMSPSQITPHPFQTSTVSCEGVEGYNSIQALKDDLYRYFEMVHGVPPPSSDGSGETVTAIPPPVFEDEGTTTTATDAGDGWGDNATVGIISTTGPTATDVLFTTTVANNETIAGNETIIAENETITTTAPAASVTSTDISTASTTVAMTPAVRKRSRVHVHRRLQENATVSVTNEEFVGENATIAVTSMDGENVTIALTSNGENATIDVTEVDLQNGEGGGTNTSTEAGGTTAPPDSNQTDYEIQPSTPIHFNICPGTYDFSSIDPIVLEATTHNPIKIRCINQCIFTGGQHHLSFNNHGSTDNSTQQDMYSLSIEGITFHNALSAVTMNDPRGEITFDSCTFQSNTGAAMIINGRYEGTHTQYYHGRQETTSHPNSNAHVAVSDALDVDDDTLQMFYQDVFTAAPITANPSPAPNSTPQPITPYPTSSVRIPPTPTISPFPTPESNLLTLPQGLTQPGYTGPPTPSPVQTTTIATSFLRETTVGTATTATVDPSTTWNPEFGPSTSTGTSSTSGFDYGYDDDGFRRGLRVDVDEEGYYYEEGEGYNEENEGAGYIVERFLQADNIPKSIIKITSCSFEENSGSSTIVLTSHHGEMKSSAGVLGQVDDVFGAADAVRAGGVPMVHSVHLGLVGCSFRSENVKRSVIMNDGGRLQTDECMFSNNTADSIIHTESGTVAMSRTEFSDNTITGESGLVVMDDESSLESNDGNCNTSGQGMSSDQDVSFPSQEIPAQGMTGQEMQPDQNVISGQEMPLDQNMTETDSGELTTMEGSEGTEDATVSSRVLQDSATAVTFENDAMVDNATISLPLPEQTDNATISLYEQTDNVTLDSSVQISSEYDPTQTSSSSSCNGIYSNGMCRQFADSCAVPELEGSESIEGCISTWDNLISAVKERPNDERDFMICPGATLDVDASLSQGPVVIDTDYITIKCGKTGSLSDGCTIVGGLTQFYVVSSTDGIELEGLKMMSSREASVVASGTNDSSLRLKNCEWLTHMGQSVVIIHNENAASADEGGLDVSALLSNTNEGAMSVEVENCIFANNTPSFGIISNIGGTLTVYKSSFENNVAKGGDIVVTNKGSSKVQESCFSKLLSTAPGTIFVEFGSSISVNTNNFGMNNTAVGSECTAIFQESEGTSCLSNPTTCDGTCMEFTSSVCSLTYDMNENASSPATSPGLAPPAAAVVVEQEGPSNLIPIVVASLVSAFVIFGLAGIIWRRKKKGKKGGRGGDDGPIDINGEGEMGDTIPGSRKMSISNPFASFSKKKSVQSQEELNDAYDEFDDLDEEDMH